MNKQREALESILQMLGNPMSPLEAKIIVTAYEALAEPEKANQCGETCERAKLCAVCANGLAEPEPEPVADSDLYAVWLNGFHSRKPLTDEEIDNLELPPNGCTMRELVRAIERAHGISEA
jgi:hypothetical protein